MLKDDKEQLYEDQKIIKNSKINLICWDKIENNTYLIVYLRLFFIFCRLFLLNLRFDILYLKRSQSK